MAWPDCATKRRSRGWVSARQRRRRTPRARRLPQLRSRRMSRGGTVSPSSHRLTPRGTRSPARPRSRRYREGTRRSHSACFSRMTLNVLMRDLVDSPPSSFTARPAVREVAPQRPQVARPQIQLHAIEEKDAAKHPLHVGSPATRHSAPAERRVTAPRERVYIVRAPPAGSDTNVGALNASVAPYW